MSDMDAKVIPDCCEQLKIARKAQKLSVKAVAEQLKLSPTRIEEIEEGRFDSSVSPAFYRGYIRSYANLLKLNTQDLLSQFNELFDETTEIKSTTRIGSFGHRKSEVSSGDGAFKWITRLIIFVILIAIAWGIKERFLKEDAATSEPSELSLGLFETESSEATVTDSRANSVKLGDDSTLEAELPTQPKASSQLQTGANLEPSVDAPVETTNQEPDQTAAPENKLNEQNSSAEITETASVENVQNDSLTMVFVGDCWVDVRDSTGQRLAFGTKNNGAVLTLEGLAPFSITLGEPSVVTLQFNGESVDLSGYPAGRPAKLNLSN